MRPRKPGFTFRVSSALEFQCKERIDSRAIESHIFRREKDMNGSADEMSKDHLFEREPWYKDVLGGYRDLRPDELIAGHESGWEIDSLCINTATYLQWLLGQCIKAGIVIKRGIISHIKEAKDLSHTGKPADIIINTTGLGSLRLGGVADTNMVPVRGQIVLVRNECSPMVSSSGTEDGPNELLYIMQRAAGGGTILGGTADVGSWESVPDPNIAVRIMKRAVEARPSMTGGKGIEGLSIIRHSVGLRPARRGGVRIEDERLDDDTWVVHNYGHAGWGYQGSYGCAEGVVELVNKIRKDRGQNPEGEPKIFSWA
jgi:D-amino-acid oxidase